MAKTSNKDMAVTSKDVKEKMKGIKYVVKDVKVPSFEEVKEEFPSLTEEEYDDTSLKYCFQECYRFLSVLYNWLINNEEAIFIQDFIHFAYPDAVKAKKVKPFAFKVLKQTIYEIKQRVPILKPMVENIKDIQDYRIFKKGLTGDWYANLVQLYLKTHNRSEWTEIQKQEITNKTQIINVDPLQDEDTTDNDTEKDS